MFKVMILMNKKPGLETAEFIRYYNERHLAYLGSLLQEIGGGGSRKHTRNFLTLDDPFYEAIPAERRPHDAPAFDAVTEVEFDTREEAMALFRALQDPRIVDRVTEDERNFVIMESIKFHVVEVHEAVRR